MRLYVNDNEIAALKYALQKCSVKDDEMRGKQLALLERVVLCEQLQDSIKRAEGK